MIANEYAKALFELTTSENAERIDDELKALCDAFAENEDAIKVLSAPNISSENKKKIIESVSKDMDELLKRFLLVLNDNQRFEIINEISNEYHSLVSNQKKMVEVEITSQKALSNDQVKKLKKVLSSKFDGSEIIIKNIVDEALIGGLKCVAAGQLIDLSIRGKIDELKNLL